MNTKRLNKTIKKLIPNLIDTFAANPVISVILGKGHDQLAQLG